MVLSLSIVAFSSFSFSAYGSGKRNPRQDDIDRAEAQITARQMKQTVQDIGKMADNRNAKKQEQAQKTLNEPWKK